MRLERLRDAKSRATSWTSSSEQLAPLKKQPRSKTYGSTRATTSRRSKTFTQCASTTNGDWNSPLTGRTSNIHMRHSILSTCPSTTRRDGHDCIQAVQELCSQRLHSR